MSYQIFISYKRKGGDDLAFLLHEHLTDAGYKVFFDTKSIEDCDFPTVIEDAIANCTDFILVLSPGALDNCNSNDDWVRREIETAIKHGRHIVPVMKVGFEFPRTMPDTIAPLAQKHAVNFPTGYFEAAFQRLVTVHLQSQLDDISMENEERIKRGAEEGIPAMINEYALKNEMGTQQTLENPAEAYSCFVKAAEKGSEAACYNLGDIFDKCSVDPILASDYKISVPLSVKDEDKGRYFHEKALEYYRKANDYAPALYRLGVAHEKQRELENAFEYYKKASDQGYPPALNAVGFYYQYGLVEETGNQEHSIEKAADYYKRAAEKNLTVALYNHARLMENASDEEYVISAYKRAFFSNPPIPQAAYTLAKLYETRKKDKITARHYYRLALENGFFRAEKELNRLDQEIKSSR